MKPVLNATALLLLFFWASSIGATAHTHVEVVYRDGQLRLLYYDYDYGEYDPADVRLDVGMAAASAIPNSAAFTNLLGEAGATTWILPQIQSGDLLWLGIGNESLTSADFAGSQHLTLLAVEGPGHFALFLSDAFGQPIAAMNSRDGVNTNDTLALPLRTHLHCNWAFSAPGNYRVRLMVSGTLRSGSIPIASEPTDYFFVVEAPPQPVLGLSVTPESTPCLALEARAGLNYEVEHSSTLRDWSVVTNVHATSTRTLHLLPQVNQSPVYFRARLR